MLVYLFIAVAIAVVAMVLLSNPDEHAMPGACPACHERDDRQLGMIGYWWTETGRGRVRCRHCGKRFKEHPDGSLVEDRDVRI